MGVLARERELPLFECEEHGIVWLGISQVSDRDGPAYAAWDDVLTALGLRDIMAYMDALATEGPRFLHRFRALLPKDEQP